MQRRKFNGPDEGFYVSQGVLTPDAKVIGTGWVQGIASLESMTRKWMNPEWRTLIPRLNQLAKEAGKSVNIVIADFYQYGAFIEHCLTANEENIAVWH